MSHTRLPIEDVLPELLDALDTSGSAVLQAPPGAGKTTGVPPALLGAPWLGDQRIVMLEPRRVAARAAAARLAGQLGERVGERVGHRMRDDTNVSSATRIEVVTEGVLTRILQSDPSLDGYGAVVFDEFHERSLHADLGLALTLEAKAALRPELRVLVMSATLEGERVAHVLGEAPVVTSEGRQFAVSTSYRPPPSVAAGEAHMASVIAELCQSRGGDILAFLPGAGWIRRVERMLAGSLPRGVVVTPLYGALRPEEQDRAIRADPSGRRKVVLATDIAETSLTIDGVRIVVDGGQRRAPIYDTRSGLTRLETVRISKASAEQRRGRAGRQAPGACHRLWSEREHAHLDAHDRPEICTADLSSLRLQLALWGAEAAELRWLDQPPEAALDEAGALLETLGALDTDGRLTPHGRAMAQLAAEPRIAHMLIAAAALDMGKEACDVAGLLSGRDPLDSRSVDLRDRVLALGRKAGGDRGPSMKQARAAARRFRRELGVGEAPANPENTGAVVALAFPDRVGRQRGASGSYQLASGRGAELPRGDPLAGTPFLAVADVDGTPEGGRIFLAAPLERADLDRALDTAIVRHEVVAWDPGRGDVVAEHQTRLGALVLKREPIARPRPDALAAAWADAVAVEGLGLLSFTRAVHEWRDRVALLRRVFGEDWPDLSDEALVQDTSTWLAPHLRDVRRRRDLEQLDLRQILGTALDWRQSRQLDELAPTHLTVPSGSHVRLDYGAGDAPVLAVRLQELFGLTETPTVAAGRVEVVLHLLSPAQRPVQVTTDLAGFWRETYPQVKAELMGRYPKHHWPEDPVTAQATNRTKKHRR